MASTTALEILIKLRDEASKGLSNFAGSIEKNANAIRGVGLGMTAVGGGLAMVTKGFITAAADAEQTKVAFTTMLGSAEEAVKFTKELADFSAKTPFELKGLEQASKQLLAYGFNQKEVLPNLRALGDIAAGVGMDKMPQLILAFGQVKAATKLTGMELRQFTEAGVPLLDELAKQFQKPVSEIQKMVSEGQIGFPAVQTALMNLTGEGGKFHNMMEQQSQTFGGLMSTMRDQVDLFMRQGGQPLIESLKGIIQQIIQVVIRVNEWAKAHPELTKIIGVATAILAALLLVLGPLLVMLPGITIAVGALGVAFTVLTGPVGIVIAIITALIAIGVMLYKNWDTIKWAAGELGTWLSDKFKIIQNAWTSVWSAVRETANNAWEGIKNMVKGSINWIIDKLNFFIRAANDITRAGNKVPGVNIPLMNEIPMLAKGGIVTRPTLAMIGEAGPEAVVPLGKGRGFGNQITVNITGNYINDSLDIRHLADEVSRAITEKLSLNQRINV